MERYEEIKRATCTHWSNSPYKEEVEKGCISETALARKIALRAFVAGAEWADAHPKNPWISVKDKAGCDTSDDCIVMVMGGDIFRAYFSSENKWMKFNCGYYDEVIDEVVWWMPIPKFNE